jgi:hypothetical protein
MESGIGDWNPPPILTFFWKKTNQSFLEKFWRVSTGFDTLQADIHRVLRCVNKWDMDVEYKV